MTYRIVRIKDVYYTQRKVWSLFWRYLCYQGKSGISIEYTYNSPEEAEEGIRKWEDSHKKPAVTVVKEITL